MSSLVFGVAVSATFFGTAVLLRNIGTQPGRFRSIFAGLLLCASLFTLGVTLVAPFTTVPKALTTIAERVLPHAPKQLQNPFRYRPTAQNPAKDQSRH